MATSAEQTAQTGSGPLLERRYYIDVLRPRLHPAELMRTIQCNLEAFSPDLLADFEKVQGQEHCLRLHDEYHIKILGPWNGSVRVTDVSDQHFEFVTLEGHPEAGRIRFSALPLDGRPDVIRFEIHSWARSRDGLVAFAYDTRGMGKQVQEKTWVLFCERVAQTAGGQALGPVQVETVSQHRTTTQHEHHAA